MPAVMQDRPPLVRFEVRAVEKRDAVGTRTFIDTDFALITPQGSKEVVEKVVEEWFAQLEKSVEDGRFNPLWLDAFRSYHAKWKKGEEVPLNGFAIKNWPSASPAEIRILLSNGILTVEDLAAANEQMKMSIGMGAVSLVQRAKDFLEAKNDQGPLVARLDAMQSTLTRIEFENRELRDENSRLNAALQIRERGHFEPAAPLPSLEERVAEAQAKGPDVRELIDATIDEELGV